MCLYTPREVKKGKLNSDDRGYSLALADPKKLAIVMAEYPVVRFSEEQGRPVVAALEVAVDGMSGNNYVSRCLLNHSRYLSVTFRGLQDGAWLEMRRAGLGNGPELKLW